MVLIAWTPQKSTPNFWNTPKPDIYPYITPSKVPLILGNPHVKATGHCSATWGSLSGERVTAKTRFPHETMGFLGVFRGLYRNYIRVIVG